MENLSNKCYISTMGKYLQNTFLILRFSTHKNKKTNIQRNAFNFLVMYWSPLYELSYVCSRQKLQHISSRVPQLTCIWVYPGASGLGNLTTYQMKMNNDLWFWILHVSESWSVLWKGYMEPWGHTMHYAFFSVFIKRPAVSL